MPTITLDGAHGEGAGTLVRTALAMSALTQQSVRIEQVRGGSKFPGLDPEDLAIIRVLERSTQAQTTGAEVGSPELIFTPTRRPGAVIMDVDAIRNRQGRGPNALIVLAAVLPVLCRSGGFSSLRLDGETYGHHALSYDIFEQAVMPLLRKFGIEAFPELTRAGFGRESNGRVEVEIEPSGLHGVVWEDRGRLLGLGAIVSVGELSPQIGYRAQAHLKRLAESAHVPLDVEVRQVPSQEQGAFVSVWAQYERAIGTGAAMGAKGLRSEALAQMAFEETFDWMTSDATLDPYLADQALIPMVLSGESCSFRVSRLSQRLLTAIWVIKQFAPVHLTVRGTENHPGVVTLVR